MKKFLPILFFILLFVQFFVFIHPVFAQTPTPPPDGTWVNDSEVTFVGMVGARAGNLLDWALQNYNWSFVSSGPNPLMGFWAVIRNIVYAFITIFVLITAFVLIITRGRSITVKRFIPRFVLIILLVTFSFALAQFIYQIVDIIQGFFLRNPDYPAVDAVHAQIWQGNLLFIGFDYKNFVGYRLVGSSFDESAFISLLLVKLTAGTYYVMVGILLLRKIILWFFVIISPIFPLLLLYSPIRNTAKIWIGEFFRWLLYAPIFAILLSGLVYIWRIGIPLKFDFSKVGVESDVIYRTSINILLGGPGQQLSLNNSVNLTDTFAQYVVALLMLWVVIILPFLLLQIFLNYMKNISISENAWIKQFATSGSSFIGKGGRNPESPSPLPLSSQPAGLARSIPRIEIPEVKARDMSSSIFAQRFSQTSSQVANLHSAQSSSEILRLTNLTVPTMRDIAKYETSAISSDISRHSEIAKVHETLERIANPSVISTQAEKERYSTVKEKLVQEGQKGNSLASSILSAASTVSTSTSSASVLTEQQEIIRLSNTLEKIANPDMAIPVEREKFITIKQQLLEAQKSGDPVAASVVVASQKGKLGANEEMAKKLKEAKEKGSSLAATILQEAGISDVQKVSTKSFPVVNRVQSVSLDDYEAVKKMWVENYQKLEPPKSVGSNNRQDWVKSDIGKITDTISMLVSHDPQNVKKGMESVGTILPFLLIGGFSQTEVIAYLKAKLEAAKAVSADLLKTDEEENTSLEQKQKSVDKPKEMSAQEELLEKQDSLNKDKEIKKDSSE